MRGEVFIDGSCRKEGPRTWHATGWSVCKVSRDGVLLASISGRMGRQLPQTSTASEHVAGLAAAAQEGATTVSSDYKNLAVVEALRDAVALHPKGMYSGVRRRIRGICSRAYEVKHCKGHVDVATCSDAEEAYKALGNQHADRIAGAAAAATAMPGKREIVQWEADSDRLERWLRYVPRALALWPTAQPTSGHKSRPKRQGPRATSGCSFPSGVLGPWAEFEGVRTSQRDCQAPSQSSQASSSGRIWPPPPSKPSEASRAHISGEAKYHDRHWQGGRWLCTSCHASARMGVPRRQKCPGNSPVIRKLLDNPRGHKLQITTFADGVGIVVICSGFGHFVL